MFELFECWFLKVDEKIGFVTLTKPFLKTIAIDVRSTVKGWMKIHILYMSNVVGGGSELV